MMSAMQFRTALESGLGSQGAAAAGLGILLHLSVFRTNFPAEDYMYTLLGFHVLSLLAAAYVYWAIAQFSLWHTIMRIGYLSSSFHVGLLLSISVYRLFFHRLKHFPGPLGSKLTRFHDAYLAAKDVQYNVEIGKLHDQYGDFVRTGKITICSISLNMSHIYCVIRSPRDFYSAEICCVVDLQSPIQVFQVDVVCSGIDGS